MDLIPFLITIVFIGLLMYLINKYVKMQPAIQRIMNIAVVVAVVIWVVRLFFPEFLHLPHMHVGRP